MRLCCILSISRTRLCKHRAYSEGYSASTEYTQNEILLILSIPRVRLFLYLVHQEFNSAYTEYTQSETVFIMGIPQSKTLQMLNISGVKLYLCFPLIRSSSGIWPKIQEHATKIALIVNTDLISGNPAWSTWNSLTIFPRVNTWPGNTDRKEQVISWGLPFKVTYDLR